MSHTGTSGPLAVGNCSQCHNGSYLAVNALAKPATHIPTGIQCDTCRQVCKFDAIPVETGIFAMAEGRRQ